MSTLARSLSGTVAVVVATLPVAAQEIDVSRRSFAFFDRSLTVEVASEAAGELHVVRGGRGRVEVAARAEPGVASVALGGSQNDRLRLATAGAGYAEYIVVVPEQVQLHIVLPDGDYPVLATGEGSTIYRWEPRPNLQSIGLTSAERGVVLAYADPVAPAEIALTDLAAVRRLSVRVQGDDFRISSSRPLQLAPGRRDRLEIRPSGDPIELVFQVPAHTRNLTLRTGADVAVSIRNGEVRVQCSPMTQQVLRDGRRWIDLTPADGRLSCGS